MFINKEGKLFGKISIIDIFVVLAIVVAALGIYTRFITPSEKVATQSQKIEYTLLVKGVRIGTAQALQNPSPITNNTTKEYIGDIIGATYTDAVEGKEFSNGEIKALTLPERYDVTVTVQVDGKINDSGFYTSTNQAITVGSTQFFSSKYANTSGVITSVKKIQ